MSVKIELVNKAAPYKSYYGAAIYASCSIGQAKSIEQYVAGNALASIEQNDGAPAGASVVTPTWMG